MGMQKSYIRDKELIFKKTVRKVKQIASQRGEGGIRDRNRRKLQGVMDKVMIDGKRREDRTR